MIYSFVFNRVGYPQCIVETPYELLGQFLSFELVSTRLNEIDQVLSNGGDIDVEVERDDAVLTICPNGEVELDIFGEGDEGGESIKIPLVEFKTIFYEWKNFLENRWKNYGA